VTATQTETATTTATTTATETATPAPPPPTTSEPAPPPSTEVPPPPDEPDPAPPAYQTDAEVRSDAAGAFGVANQYWVNLFGTWHDDDDNPIQWWTPRQYNGDGFYDSATGSVPGCHGDYDNEGNAFFCPDGPYFGAAGTGTVAWDLDLFRLLDNGIGDAPIYVTVAHELGHAAQERFLFDREYGAVPVSDVGQENQADCLAGATLRKAAEEGNLTFEDGDMSEINDFLVLIADGETHGTPEERTGLFALGYSKGDIESCLFDQGSPPPGWFGPPVTK